MGISIVTAYSVDDLMTKALINLTSDVKKILLRVLNDQNFFNRTQHKIWISFQAL